MNAIAIAQTRPAITLAEDGHAVTTSLVVASHFGKRHRDVLRAIRQIEDDLAADASLADFRERNFALTSVDVPQPNGGTRSEPAYLLTRDGFSLLAMGFTGPEANRWKVAYIEAFNAMEARLNALYVAPLPSDKEFTRGIRMKDKLTLHEQSHQAMRRLKAEADPDARRNLYWMLHRINTAAGLPVPAMSTLGIAPLPLQGGTDQ